MTPELGLKFLTCQRRWLFLSMNLKFIQPLALPTIKISFQKAFLTWRFNLNMGTINCTYHIGKLTQVEKIQLVLSDLSMGLGQSNIMPAQCSNSPCYPPNYPTYCGLMDVDEFSSNI
uniref:Uncharacterized protein n=1 Tax=Cacopsylla melanoneura TaxID=428564 RepID=A0A8D8TFG8_9HEMI